jgi:cytochrome P450
MSNQHVDFSSENFLRNPYPGYDVLRQQNPLTWDDDQAAWLVLGYQEARRLSRDERLSASTDMWPFVEPLARRHPGAAKQITDHYESWVLFSDGSRHTRLRSLVAPALSGEAAASQQEALRKRAGELLAAAGSSLDVVRDFALPLSRLSLAHVLGVPEERLAEGARWAAELVEFVNADLEEDQALRTACVISEMAAFVEDIKVRRPSPGSVGEALARGMETGELDAGDAAGMVGQMVSGVMGAQPYLVGNGVLLIWPTTPDGAAVTQPPGLASLVEEVLRLDPPFLIVPRTAAAPIPLGDVTIKPGERLGILLGAVNRDPRAFACPHRLDPAARRKPHMSFGTGVHYCLGSHLVRMFTQVALGELLAAFPPASTVLVTGHHEPYFGLRAPRAACLRRG